MPIMLHNGLPLIVDGKLAMSKDCCCCCLSQKRDFSIEFKYGMTRAWFAGSANKYDATGNPDAQSSQAHILEVDLPSTTCANVSFETIHDPTIVAPSGGVCAVSANNVSPWQDIVYTLLEDTVQYTHKVDIDIWTCGKYTIRFRPRIQMCYAHPEEGARTSTAYQQGDPVFVLFPEKFFYRINGGEWTEVSTGRNAGSPRYADSVVDGVVVEREASTVFTYEFTI